MSRDGEDAAAAYCQRRHELETNIGRVLRAAAGLMAVNDPLIVQKDETHLPRLDRVADGVIQAASSVRWSKPHEVQAELAKFRRDLAALQARIAEFDSLTRAYINKAGDPFWREFEAARARQDMVPIPHLSAEVLALPLKKREQKTIPTALAALARLEVACAEVEAKAAAEAKGRDVARGPTNLPARQVALEVGAYLTDVKGEPPKLSRRGSDPTGPYARALHEILDLLGLNPGSFQRAGEWAIKQLESKS